MGEKTRRPYLLSDDDLDTFSWDDMKAFLAGPNSLPNRPDHLVTPHEEAADDFHAKLDEYRASRDVQSNATSAFAEAVKAIREKLRWMQMALPGLTPGSDEILVPFGLDEAVPADNDSMKNYADAIYAHWLTVRLEPLFAPFQANIDALDALFTAYETAQANQTTAQEACSLLQNEKDACRTELENILKALLNWYRIYYKDPEDEYWTQTPWGKASGGGEPSGEIGVPTNLNAVVGSDDVRITWDAVEDVDGYQLVHTQFPPLFLGLYEGEATEFLHEMPDNGTHYYRVRAKVGDNYGEYCEAVSADVVVEAPPAPTKLKISLGGDNRTKVTWDSPSGTVYNGCSLYSVDVPTGSPVPDKPDEPMWDELIVYSITLGELAPGMTRYVWVTGEISGAESEATGPAWVSRA
ncbi:MAG: hypothetical protein ACP5G4_05805 [bacterium]